MGHVSFRGLHSFGAMAWSIQCALLPIVIWNFSCSSVGSCSGCVGYCSSIQYKLIGTLQTFDLKDIAGMARPWRCCLAHHIRKVAGAIAHIFDTVVHDDEEAHHGFSSASALEHCFYLCQGALDSSSSIGRFCMRKSKHGITVICSRRRLEEDASGRDENGNGSSYGGNDSKGTNASKSSNNALKATKSPNIGKATKSSKSPKGSKSSKGYHPGSPPSTMYPSSYVPSPTTYVRCSCLFTSD